MKIERLFLSVCVCLLLCIGCNNPTKIQFHQDVQEIDMSQYETVDFNSLIKDLKFTQLVSGNVPVFEYCQRMVRYKDYIYLLTGNTSGSYVFIYENTGKLIKRITFGTDVFFVNTIFVHPEQNQLWIITGFNELNRYELDGTFISRNELPFACTDLISINGEEFLLYDGGMNRNWDYLLTITDLTIADKFFIHKKKPFHGYNIPESMFASDINTGNIFIHLNRNDTVYLYNPETENIKPYYHLNFHGEFLTQEMMPESGISDKEMHDIIQERRYIIAKYSFYLASGRLFFKLSGKREDFCTIHLQDHSIKSFTKLFDDLPYTSYNPFIGSDGNSLFMLTKESHLVKHYHNHECTYPAIRELLPSLSEEGNSWILVETEII